MEIVKAELQESAPNIIGAINMGRYMNGETNFRNLVVKSYIESKLYVGITLVVMVSIMVAARIVKSTKFLIIPEFMNIDRENSNSVEKINDFLTIAPGSIQKCWLTGEGRRLSCKLYNRRFRRNSLGSFQFRVILSVC